MQLPSSTTSTGPPPDRATLSILPVQEQEQGPHSLPLSPQHHSPVANHPVELLWTAKSPAEPGDSARGSFAAPLPRAPGDSPRHHITASSPGLAGTKRSTSFTPPGAPASEPLHKRRRMQENLRYPLDQINFANSTSQLPQNCPPSSPLFFSSRETRPCLPARFSSSELAGKMLSKTREESGVKTVTLARGTFSGLSPQGPNGISGSRSERSSLPRTASPEPRDRNDPLRLLGSVGIVELLEQDGRPTFIVDTEDASNYAPESSSLQILFANNALRSSSSLWELVTGKLPDSSTEETISHATTQFRGWLLSNDGQGETVEMNPSPIQHGGIVWSCYTLRKRLRVVSGTVPVESAISLPSTDITNEFAIPSASSMGLLSTNGLGTSSSGPPGEPQDYFGNSVPMVTQEEPTPPIVISPAHPILPNGTNTKEISAQANTVALSELGSANTISYIQNGSVLRAYSAGDIDPFHREEARDPPDHDMGFFDWTRLSLNQTLPKHIEFARSIDWASTPLGPIEFWSNDLRAMCNLIM